MTPANGQHIAFTPGRLGAIELRNRIIKTATYEGMCPGGVPSGALIEHHRTLAQGGVGMTTVAYCAVSPSGRTFAEQMYMHDAIIPKLRALTDAVHAAGAAVSLQLGHCGFFSKNTLSGRVPLGPSFTVNQYGLMSGMPFARAMSESHIAQVIDDFGTAAAGAVDAGFDAVELHLGHGYLLSQFISPATNRRRDRWGGSLDNRMRLPLAVVQRVRERVGPRGAILAKTNLRDGFRGGLQLDEAVGVARRLEAAGVDAIVLSGGFTSKTPFYLFRGGRPLKEMIEVEKSRLQKIALRLFGASAIKEYPFKELFFLDDARAVRQAVRMPLVLLGGALSIDNLDTAMREGFEFVAMGRALIADPDLINRMQRGEVTRSRCTSCNKCVAEMDRDGVRCVL
ncbi:MAG TPA: NADH:flavin oxidoreductase [Candidatus Margulisiibacteriota bacterium]|nr:NADH:flavin oxidoreductase [Candidatus Margulisiibacteriota bacterium]